MKVDGPYKVPRRWTTRLRRKTLPVLILLGSMTVSAVHVEAQSEWIIPVTVTHVANTATDTFGVAYGATYCIDAELGETELPPRPPAGVFDTRFVESRDGSTCLGQGLRLHLQSFEFGLDTFQLSFQKGDPAGTNSWTVSWPLDRTCSWASLILTDALGLGLVNVDMTTTSSVTITQSFITSVNIIGSSFWPFTPLCGEAVSAERDPLPRSFELQQNFPNPFNPTTEMRYSVASEAFAELAVFDLLGRRIALLSSGVLKPGRYTTTWHGADEAGGPAASGVYYLRMVATGGNGVHFSAVRKLLLMR